MFLQLLGGVHKWCMVFSWALKVEQRSYKHFHALVTIQKHNIHAYSLNYLFSLCHRILKLIKYIWQEPWRKLVARCAFCLRRLVFWVQMEKHLLILVDYYCIWLKFAFITFELHTQFWLSYVIYVLTISFHSYFDKMSNKT